MNEKLIIGFEGSANKLGIGIITYTGNILVNERLTFQPPVGQGFLPAEISTHHEENILPLTIKVLSKLSKILLKKEFNNSKNLNKLNKTTNIKYSDKINNTKNTKIFNINKSHQSSLESKIISSNKKNLSKTLSLISGIAFTEGPGIGSALSVVSDFTKTLSYLYKIPLIPVNHCIAHIEMGILKTGARNPLILYASGANTQFIKYSENNKKYNIIGETSDMAIGNVLDRCARILEVENYPNPGFNIEKNAKEYFLNFLKNSKDKIISKEICDYGLEKKLFFGRRTLLFPVKIEGWNFKISGITEFLKQDIKVNYTKNNSNLGPEDKLFYCYWLQENLFGALCKIMRSIVNFYSGKGSEEENLLDGIMLTGGVGCNERLQEMLGKVAQESGLEVFGMDESYCVDNGVMIAWNGCQLMKEGKVIKWNEAKTRQEYKTDEVEVIWK